MVASARDVSVLLDSVARRGAGVVSNPEVMNWFLSDQLPSSLQSDPGQGFGGGWAYVRSSSSGSFSSGTVTWGGVYGHRWFADPSTGISAVLLTDTAMAGMSGNTMDHLTSILYSAR
jgi:CubicO group peptidase (beta-lactamase class C family)